jgi:hypothetical protein
LEETGTRGCARPTTTGDIARSVLVLVQFEDKMIG